MSDIQQRLRQIRLIQQQPRRDQSLRDLVFDIRDLSLQQSRRILNQISDPNIKRITLADMIYYNRVSSLEELRQFIDQISDPVLKSYALCGLSLKRDILSVAQVIQILNQITDPDVKMQCIAHVLRDYHRSLSVAQAIQLSNQITDPVKKTRAFVRFAQDCYYTGRLSERQLRQIRNRLQDLILRQHIGQEQEKYYTQSQQVQRIVHKKGQKIPAQFYDPVFMKLMVNPITTKDGRTYQYKDIRNWWEISKTVPQNRQPLQEPKKQNINKELKERISKYRKKVLPPPRFMERGPLRRALLKLFGKQRLSSQE